MKFIKNYNSYLESLQVDFSYQNIDLNESLNIWHQSILNSIGAQPLDIKEIFDINNNQDLEKLSKSTEFFDKLTDMNLKHSTVENTDNYETFINKTCRFMLIYQSESNELQNPEYIMIQSWNNSLNKWENIELYKINDDIKKFYDKLSSKTVEVISNGINYIYTTSNGNEWNLSNSEKSNDTFKKYLRKDEFEEILKSNKVKINII